jgi:UDP-N-acetylmuramoyl-tripeptide--D-alanyl-D-alanine ligase
MRPRSLEEVAAAVDGSVGGDGDVIVRGAAVDSRQAGQGDLFVALPGEHADGHDFVGDAMARGASAAMVRRGWRGGVVPTVEVGDPGAALLRLARDERSTISAQVVAITGSTGKTMTKDLTAAVLGRRFRVVASPASFNNEVGLPLTLLRADERTEAVVCEMGSRGPGHIRLLCEVATPTVGVVTNVGEAHMQLFGSREVLRDAKAELPEALPAGGVAVLNADDPVVRTYADRTRARVVLFGTASAAEVSAESIDLHRGTGQAEFMLRTPDGSAPVLLPVPGEHMVGNALAAAAVGWALGVPVESSAQALATAPVTGGRMQTAEAGGVRIVNDAYNANPTSTAAALRAIRWMAGSARCIAVLGHMAELGPIADEEHERIGELVARLGIDVLVVVGPDARLIGVAARREGVPQDAVVMCDDVVQATKSVLAIVRPGDLVLVKASRVARLERVADALQAALDQPAKEAAR